MKVDSKGNPVSEGTHGIYLPAGLAARVERTYVNPIEDDARASKIIAEGGYLLNLGEAVGLKVVEAKHFEAASHANDVVLDVDGKVIEAGDIISIEGVGDNEEVNNVYPLGMLAGFACLSLKKHKGGAPDGQYGVPWGAARKLVKKAAEVKKDAKSGASTGVVKRPTPTLEWHALDKKQPMKGDLIDFVNDNDIVVQGVVHTPQTENTSLKVTLTEESIKERMDSDWPDSNPPYVVNGNVLRIGTAHKKLGWVYPGDIVTLNWSGAGKASTTAQYAVIRRYEKYKNDTVVLITPWNKEGAEFLKKSGLDPVIGQDQYSFHTVYIAKVVDHVSDYDGLDEDNELEEAFLNDAANNNENEGDDDMASGTQAAGVSKSKVAPATRLDIVREGTKIVVPDGMSTRSIIKELERQAAQEETDVSIMELIEGFPLDAAHALVQAMAAKYGWVNALPTPGFFGPTPPVMIGVTVDPDGRTVQIPWGQLGIPGLSGKLATGIQFVDQRPVFCLQGTVKQKDKGVVNEIAQMAREYLKDHSIYKGKAFKITFPEPGSGAFSPLDHQPKFIQTTDVRPDELIFSKDVEKQVAINIWTPIRNLAAVKAARVPLKRGVLLYGRYGVGKTLLASVTARMAVQAGVTFMDLADSRQLPQAIQFARQLGGMVVIFAEDIDRCDDNGNRTDAFNEILNTVDGLTSKTDEVLIVYTTNHIEKISKAMLRQGRIDKVIHIKEPDSEAAQRLVRLYARHMLLPSEDLIEVGKLLHGFIPAAIREVVEQSKLSAIERGAVHKITAEDLRVTAENTLEHMELLKEQPVDDRSEFERFGVAMGKEIAKGLDLRLAAEGWGDGEGSGVDEGEGGESREILEGALTSPARRRVKTAA